MENRNLPQLKRLSVDISEKVHTDIKTRAALRNITMRTWVVRAIVNALKEDKKYE